MTAPYPVLQLLPAELRAGDLLEVRGEISEVTALDPTTTPGHVLITAGHGTGAYPTDVTVTVRRPPTTTTTTGDLEAVRDLALTIAGLLDRGQIGTTTDRATLKTATERARGTTLPGKVTSK